MKLKPKSSKGKYISAKQGWLKLRHPEKFMKPLNEYMDSSRDGYVEYKSGLERAAFIYADLNPKIAKFSVEPFAIMYQKPEDQKMHRYFPDMFIEFVSGQKFIVEIKSKGETRPPSKPKQPNPQNMASYKKACLTFMTNQAKWNAAKSFAESQQMKFIILTEDELKD